MVTRTGPIASQSGIIDEPEEYPCRLLCDHPVMNKLDTILRELPNDRQAAFIDMLQKDETSYGEKD